MDTYQQLVDSVIISSKSNRLLSYDDSLTLIGTGRSAFVFQINESNQAIKVFFPEFKHIAEEEAEIYRKLEGISYFPIIYASGENYLVMDFIEGRTLFRCINDGATIKETHIRDTDYALSLAAERGLNPSDIHLRNIIITTNDEVKLIDVARFNQTKNCSQWDDLKYVYHRFYSKRMFPKKIPASILNVFAYFYKKPLIAKVFSLAKSR
ncbi:MAG: protein kinase family protein [Paenisporosarcina sp.]